MKEWVIAALVVSVVLIGLSGGVFAFPVPVWLPVLLVVASVLMTTLLLVAVTKPRGGYKATTGAGAEPQTPGRGYRMTSERPMAPLYVHKPRAFEF